MRDLDEMKLMCTKPSTSGCEDEFAVRCTDLMRQNAKVMPTSQREAIDLYGWLRSLIKFYPEISFSLDSACELVSLQVSASYVVIKYT